MIWIVLRLIFLSLTLINIVLGQWTQGDFLRADSLVRRLPPSAFPQLPEPIRTTLDDGGFTIPQSFGDTLPHNVVMGEFRKHGEHGWAVLASKNRVSSILIFWNESGTDTTHLSRAADYGYLQSMGDLGIAFSRSISAVRLNIDTDCIDFEPHERPTEIDHDAIEDGFLSKASTAFYFNNGRWFSCATGD